MTEMNFFSKCFQRSQVVNECRLKWHCFLTGCHTKSAERREGDEHTTQIAQITANIDTAARQSVGAQFCNALSKLN